MDFKPQNKLLTIFSFSSLTDIVMLLLVFFLLTSSFVVLPGVKVVLPKSESRETESKQPVTVTLSREGFIYLNADIVTENELGPKLSSVLEGAHEKVVVINADESVQLQSAVRVMDIAKGAGASKLIIATRPAE